MREGQRIITESQNVRDSKRPQKIIQFNPLDEAGTPRLGHTGMHPHRFVTPQTLWAIMKYQNLSFDRES